MPRAFTIWNPGILCVTTGAGVTTGEILRMGDCRVMPTNVPKSIAEIDFANLTKRQYTPSPDCWADQILYFLMLDRFSDGNEKGGYRDARDSPEIDFQETILRRTTQLTNWCSLQKTRPEPIRQMAALASAFPSLYGETPVGQLSERPKAERVLVHAMT